MIYINKIIQGNSLEVLKTLEENSIDSIVTDPPYELGFMGKAWDSTGIANNIELWKECLRVLKPGGHLLSFGGTRTYHRMACAIEDAGFEVRDQIQWIYGSGFPKSQNISKAIDKKLGKEREVIGVSNKQASGFIRHGRSDEEVFLGNDKNRTQELITAPASDEAIRYNGWGTALKPANEPIVMARKPLFSKTIVGNVLEWGTGGINIDESRVHYSENDDPRIGKKYAHNAKAGLENGSVKDNASGQTQQLHNSEGRFPANVILDDYSGSFLDEQSDLLKSGKMKDGDLGGASRFFYCAKAAKKEKGDYNNHPTVKPLRLMEYLVNLVTPKGGVVLDPFSGSGSTLVAAKNKGFSYIGIEMEEEYIDIANQRLK